MIANGLAEEILFRGFLTKRFINVFGQLKGILLQAVFFALMHNVLYLVAGLEVSLWYHVLMFIYTGLGALQLAYLNEKLFNGSIWPSVCFHGIGNFISAIIMIFGL